VKVKIIICYYNKHIFHPFSCRVFAEALHVFANFASFCSIYFILHVRTTTCMMTSMLYRAGGVESVDTAEAVTSCDDGTMKRGVASSVSAAGDVSSRTSCPALTDESDHVQQFLTSHAVNGGVVNLLLAYLTELTQRRHLRW